MSIPDYLLQYILWAKSKNGSKTIIGISEDSNNEQNINPVL